MNEGHNRHPQGNRPEWKEVKRFTIGSLAVSVSALQGFRPRYSVQAGRLRDDGTINSHVPVQIDGTFQVKIAPFASDLGSMLEAAREWIATEVALRASDDIEKRIEKETKQANFGKQETRVTGKTAKKKARRLGSV